MDKSLFAKVYIAGYSIAWSDQLEFDALSIYMDLSGKNFGDIRSNNKENLTLRINSSPTNQYQGGGFTFIDHKRNTVSWFQIPHPNLS
ncbi:MAG: hypothetical protein RLY85_214 [Bacteroidota bacterium]